jgi:hypothetical protein
VENIMEIRLDYTQPDNLAKIVLKLEFAYRYVNFWRMMKRLFPTINMTDMYKYDVTETFSNHEALTGVLILESKPQTRMIRTNDFYYSSKFDYLIHAIQYIKYKDKYLYLGIANRSLMVCQSDKSLESLDSPVKLSFTDTKFEGLVCLDHTQDHQIFNSKKELVNFVLDSWWKITHENSFYYEKPNQMPLRQFLNQNTWFSKSRGIGPMILPSKSDLIREPISKL